MSPATDWKEIVTAGEAERFETHATRLRELQHGRARDGKAMRGLHAKGQAGLEAEFTVLPDLPDHARVGLFAKPGAYRAFVRVSNGLGVKRSDPKPDVRGFVIKVLGVEGKKIIPGLENAKTQDFSMIRATRTPFRTADEFVWVVLGAASPATLLPRMLWRFGPMRTIQILRDFASGNAVPMTSVATTQYFSVLPVKFGAFAAKYTVAPRAPAEPGAKAGTASDYLAEDLAARLSKGALAWDFRVQFFRDEKSTPIEDASVEWKESDAPFLTVGTLTIPQQDMGSARGKKLAAFVETLSFDPWHALEELRPLGNMMRARGPAYRLSTQEREAAPEPDGTEKFE